MFLKALHIFLFKRLLTPLIIKIGLSGLLLAILAQPSSAQIRLPFFGNNDAQAKSSRVEKDTSTYSRIQINRRFRDPRFYPLDADSILSKLSLSEKVGQLFFTSANGYFKNVDDEEYKRLVHRVTTDHIGGLIFFRGDVYDQAILTNKLQEISTVPLWITQDMENGAAMRVNGATRFTPAMGIAATNNPDNAYTVGQITAQEASALGVHQIFAPVLDVNNNPANPVINVRSFSEQPQLVSEYGSKFIKGVHDQGLISTAKHFPGHGDTDTDSHTELPILNHTYAQLDSVELIPFRSAVQAGIPSVMSAHIAFPNLSHSKNIPSTLDAAVLKRILVDSLSFDGVVVTDGLRMHGISNHYSPGDAVIKALQAGADMMLLSPDEHTAIHEVKMAVKRGELSEKRIDKSVRKLLQWKISHGLFEKSQVSLDKLSEVVNSRYNQGLSERIARESITVLRNTDDLLPIRADRHSSITVISLADDESGRTGSYFARKMRDYHPDVSFHVFDKRSSNDEIERMIRSARNSSMLILGSFIYVESNKPIQLNSKQRRIINRLMRLDKPTGVIAFGNPYVLQDIPGADLHMLAWSSSSIQVRSAVQALFGASSVQGRLPISIPGLYSFGAGMDLPQTTIRLDNPESVGLSSDTLQTIDTIMRNAIQDSVFPGGVVGVLKDGILAHWKGYGYHDYEKIQEVKKSDVYDIASLTKIVATTTAVMKLVDEKKLDINDPVGKYIDTFREGRKKKIRIKNLLLHNSGLPPFRLYVDSLNERSEILDAVKHEPLINRPFSEYVYSDLGYILLADIVEQITGQRLDKYLRKEFYYPLGMASTFYNPDRLGKWMVKRIPPTEIDTMFRQDTVHAVVHDERAYYMDGVSGHAGLFSSANDLAVYAQMLLNGGTYAGKRYLNESTIRQFTSRQSAKSNRGFGFDRKSEGFSTAGRLTSEDTFGHLGFTGTSLWIDRERNMAIILLTNRTFPYRSYGKDINQIRSRVADTAVRSIIENSLTRTP
jgi:beta-glucosidase-like glycosyl hydrolase/CubicO group peptidase (beta-lactamase class C family)